MIDHVAGRPSPRFRKYQVFTVVLLWTIYLSTTDKHGPKPIRSLSRYLSRRFTTWRALVTFCLTLYVSRNFARVVGLHSPEPLANLYTRNYFRATWVTTALDAGFWTAMNIRPAFVRDFASIIFTLYYLVCAEQADEMVRRVRGQLTLQHLRVSWDKPNTPYIRAFTNLFRGKLMSRKPERLRIARPKASDYTEPIEAWLYFDGPRDELKYHDKIILDIPGGGFVAMDPRCHDDKLMAWAGRTGLPVLALNYKKAPEYPYPYALHECYDVYHSIISSRGRCVGLAGTHMPKIVLSGDSAGGNLATGLTLMLLQESPHTSYYAGDRPKNQLPLPESLVLIYPALDVNINNWITDEQMSLIRAPEKRKINQGILDRKRTDYTNLTPNTPHGSDEGLDMKSIPRNRSKPAQWLSENSDVIESPAAMESAKSKAEKEKATTTSDTEPAALRTRLAMSSMISYFNDRILSPEMLRSMIILYIGPHQRPDFATDYLLSPLLAPEQLLVRFPKIYMLCGERDPLVDNTVIFAGRIREARKHQLQERKELGLVPADTEFDDTKHVEVMLVPGISHGFLQFVSVFPEGWKYIFQCSRWMREVFQASVARDLGSRGSSAFPSPTLERSHPASVGVSNPPPGADYFSHTPTSHRKKSSVSGDANSDTEDRPLEMSRLRMTSAVSSKQHAAGLSALNTAPVSHVKSHHHNRAGMNGSTVANRKSPRAAPFSGRRSPLATRKSLVRLSSHEDLMKRRMQGLTMGLVNGEDDGVPGTP